MGFHTVPLFVGQEDVGRLEWYDISYDNRNGEKFRDRLLSENGVRALYFETANPANNRQTRYGVRVVFHF